MNSPRSSLLSIPVTDEERRRQRADSHDGQRLMADPTQHARDSQFDPRVGRYRSLRVPGERYDDPDGDHKPGSSERSYNQSQEDPAPLLHSEIDSTPPQRRMPSSFYSTQAYEPVRTNALTRRKTDYEPRYWEPFWLRRSTLVVVALFMAACLGGLLAVYASSTSNNGFAINSMNDSYAWTFGPTAVMVLVVCLWRQVDYHAKSLQPWKELRGGPTDPSTSILLDYVSPFQIVAFSEALRRLHLPVIFTIISFVAAKLMTIASTGLFDAKSNNFSDGFSTTRQHVFSAPPLGDQVYSSYETATTVVYDYYGNIFNDLPFSTGVSNGFAYLPLTLNSTSKRIPNNATFTATTDSFVPTINCTAVNITFNGPSSLSSQNITFNSTESPFGNGNLNFTINDSSICANWPDIVTRAIDPVHYVAPERQIEGTLQELFCADSDGSVPRNSKPVGLLFTLTEIHYAQTLITNATRPQGGRLPIALQATRLVPRIVNTICQPSYTLSQINMTKDTRVQDPGGLTFTFLPQAQNTTISDLTRADLITSYISALNASASLFSDVQEADNQTTIFRTGAFDLLGVVAGTNEKVTLFDFDVLDGAIQSTYKGILSNFASRVLTRSINADHENQGSIASVEWIEDRLYANEDPLFFMVAGFGLLLVAALVLLFIAPRKVLPRDPNSIAANATILTRSVELNRLLRRVTQPQAKSISAALDGFLVGTAIASTEDGTNSFRIHVSKGRPSTHSRRASEKPKFWHPVASSIPVVALTVLCSLAIIAVLAVLQARSDDKNGLLNVPDDSSTFFASRYVPILFFLLVASAFNNIDFYVGIFSPWAAMQKVQAVARRSVLTNVVGLSPPLAISAAIRGHYWGALLSTSATLFAALLSVVSANLYAVQDSQVHGPTRSLERQDTFNLAANYLVDNDNGAAAMFNLIENNNLSFPDFTFDEFAFPNMSLGGFETPIRAGSTIIGSMTATLPALMGNLTCDLITDLEISGEDNAISLTTGYTLSAACVNGLGEVDDSASTMVLQIPSKGGNFVGKVLDLRFGQNSSLYGHFGEENATLVGNNPAVGCPSLAFVWGIPDFANAASSRLQVAICHQQILELTVNATFEANSTQFDMTRPPHPANMSNIEAVANPNSTTGARTFDFRIQENLQRQLVTSASDSNVDGFFQTVLNGTNSTSVENLTSSDQRAMMIITHHYRRYMAQALSAVFREPISSTKREVVARQTAGATHLGDMQTFMTMPRLVQNQASAMTLQVLLGTATFLLIIGYFLTRMRHVIPVNPCSIAGTMSLLAGSDLCYSVDDGICECCGKPRRHSFPSMPGSSRSNVETIHAEDDEHSDPLAQRVQMIRDNVEWMDPPYFDRVFEGHRYTLTDWPEDGKKNRRARYGVDVDADREWSLGNRVPSDNFENFIERTSTQRRRRGRRRAVSQGGSRGSYQRADVSPGESHELTAMPGVRGRWDRTGGEA